MFQDGSARLATFARGPGAPVTVGPGRAGRTPPTQRTVSADAARARPGDLALPRTPLPFGRGPGGRGPSSLPRSGRRRNLGRALGPPDRRRRRRIAAAAAGLFGGTSPDRPLPAFVPDRSRAPTPGEVHAAVGGRGGPAGASAARPREGPDGEANPCADRPPPPSGESLNLPASICAAPPFASRRLHVLLNSLFRVLFNFPSRYLCSIGLVQVFSLGWSLPPAFGLHYKTTRLPEARLRPRPAPAWA